jgi:hypothetical protein
MPLRDVRAGSLPRVRSIPSDGRSDAIAARIALVCKAAMLEQEWRSPRGLRRFLDQDSAQAFRDGRVASSLPADHGSESACRPES